MLYCLVSTENEAFKKVIEKTIEKQKRTSDSEALEYFYQEISHQDYEEEAFNALVSCMNKEPGLMHIKDILFKGTYLSSTHFSHFRV